MYTATDPECCIIETASRHDARLIVLGSRGEGQFRRTVLGGVSKYVLRHAHCPVAICHPPNRDGAGTGCTTTTPARRTSSYAISEYETEYLVISWVQPRLWVLFDELEYEHEPMIRSISSIFAFFSHWKRECLDSPHKPGTVAPATQCPSKFSSVYLFSLTAKNVTFIRLIHLTLRLA